MTAADRLRRLLGELERAGTTVMALARRGRPQTPWTLYPGEHGVFDRTTRCQFYYHAHAGATHEAGHFHTVRLFPDRTAHLVAISMTDAGWPQRLFTLNLWAIGDAYAPPAPLKRWVREWRLAEAHGEPRLVRFVNLVFAAFRPEIERLQDEKVAALRAWRAAHPGRDPFEDRSLEVLSEVAIEPG